VKGGNMRKDDVLVRVQISGSRYVKMYKKDAIAKGLLKEKAQVPNKMIASVNNKAVVPAMDDLSLTIDSEVQDFTEIPGVGASTAQKIVDHGITTLLQLQHSDLSFLPKFTQAAIRKFFED